MAGLPSSINSVANTIADAVEKRNSGMAHTGSGQGRNAERQCSKTLSKEQAATVERL